MSPLATARGSAPTSSSTPTSDHRTRIAGYFNLRHVGTIPQDLKFGGETSYVEIGPGVTIREFVTIHRGTEPGGGITERWEKIHF
jgi:acyl-[acyl carrier protein]--UDP-N-acetylglucosamine O-acyltransferase